jgi:isoleucyl-tRNA synthetase
VQNLRKDTGLDVTDRISITLFGSDRLKTAWESFAEYVAAETLAVSVVWGKAEGQIPIDAGEIEPSGSGEPKRPGGPRGAEQWLVCLKKV